MGKETTNPELLLHYHHTGAMAAGDHLRPAPSALGAVLNEDEVWEITHHPVISFNEDIAGAGVVRDLRVYPVVDGTDAFRPYLNYYGSQDLNFNPPHPFVSGPIQPKIGSLVEALADMKAGAPLNLVLEKAATPKVASSLTLDITAVTQVNQDFDIKIYGRRWNRKEFDRVFGHAQIGGRYAVQRITEDNSIAFDFPRFAVEFGAWDTLPGGVKQPTLSVWPLTRTAINAQATSRNTPYRMGFFSGQQANVQDENQDQDFRLIPGQVGGNRVLAIKGLGVRTRYAAALTGTHLYQAWFGLDSDIVYKEHPAGRWLVTDQDNARVFGWQAPVGPGGLYRSVPGFNLYVFNDRGSVYIQDDGAAVVNAGEVASVIQGVIVSGYTNARITQAGKQVS